jgi:hypothetical protein
MLKSVQVRRRTNDRWRRFWEDRSLTIEPKPIFGPEDTVFSMGSCFAREIRMVLSALGVRVTPNYANIPLDPERYRIDDLPADPHLNYYNSFTMLQEFERHSGLWTQAEHDRWEVPRSPFGPGAAFQDPYKRLTFGRTPADLLRVVSLVNAAIDAGIARADVFFFTFGMVEVFQKHDDGRIACQKPAYLGGGGAEETTLRLSSFAENLTNMEALRARIKAARPDARIVVTVSPVPLERTFSNRDIVVANTEGKATLRAAAGEFARAHDDVTYFPAYEIVTAAGETAYEGRDLRHVNASTVEVIMRAFVKAHVARPSTG